MILTTGEVVMDCFASERDNFTMGLDVTVGGSSLNVAIAIQRLGGSSGMLGALSRDVLGTMVLNKMRHEGLTEEYLHFRDKPSTMAIVSKDNQGNASYSFMKENAADLDLGLDDLPGRLSPAVKAVHFGSYGLHTDPLGSTLRSLIWRESGRRFISLDVNVRESVIPDMEVWRDHTEMLAPFCALVKASHEDISKLYPTELPDNVIDRWLKSGVSLVVLTHGDRGITARTRDCTVQVDAVEATVIDTVGAGDTVQGALLFGLDQADALNRGSISVLTESKLSSLLIFAAQAAAITCSRQGAEPPTAAEMPALQLH